ncbi:lysophospholipase [Phakopsora pachyrhizi]|nr:lysophospholipase [Phakopsora pachyrhizi]
MCESRLFSTAYGTFFLKWLFVAVYFLAVSSLTNSKKTQSYTPQWVTCPKNLGVLLSSSHPWPVSSAERHYLNRINITGFNTTHFLSGAVSNGEKAGYTLPNFAFTIAGGGNRALLYGASILDAFDSRNPQAEAARTGGILQLANYAAGLSASSWLLAGWATNDYERVSSLVHTVWSSAFEREYMDWGQFKKLPHCFREVRRKKKAGFPVSIVENNNSERNKNPVFSSLRNSQSYLESTFPFPILISTSRKGEGEDLDLDGPIYEFTPEDFNVWHNDLNASIPMEYLGSRFSSASGAAVKCARGFDNTGFIMVSKLIDGRNPKRYFWSDLADFFVKGKMYEALVPNPFEGLGRGLTPGSGFADSEKEELLLTDGAMVQENLPIIPLLKPSRKLDVIIAVDGSVNGRSAGDVEALGYPNGSALYQAYRRTQKPGYQGLSFPRISNTSEPESFIVPGYNKRATFFGCGEQVPLVVYLPNYFVSHTTNQTTTQAIYSREEIDGFLENGFYIATQTNQNQRTNKDWPVCLACALVDHQNIRNNVTRTEECTKCFQKYCAGGFL